MKKIFLAILTVFCFAFVHAQQSIPLGAEIPLADHHMKSVTEKVLSIKEVMGENGVIVMFSCNTCPYVIKNQKRTIEISKYAASNGFGVIIINSNEAYRDKDDSFEAMKKYAEEQGYQWPYVVDEASKVADAFGASRTPEIFVFNNKGILVYKGAIDDNPSDASNVKRTHLKEAIDEIVAGKEVSVKESKSVGCTIKRTK